MNIQGMDPSARSAGSYKISLLRNLVSYNISRNTLIPFLSITETWLKPYILDAQVSIPDYNIFRSDRRSRIRGGALLYIHESIPVINSESFDDQICEGVVCTSSRKRIIASLYRPPKSAHQSFCNLIDFLETYIKKVCSNSPEHYQIIVTGDLNFPDISWEDLSAENCLSENRGSAQYLLSFMSRFLLTQYVNIATRESNVLDLLITNDPNLVQHCSSEGTIMSDHNCISIMSSDFLSSKNPQSCHENKDELNFQKLNYHRADFN